MSFKLFDNIFWLLVLLTVWDTCEDFGHLVVAGNIDGAGSYDMVFTTTVFENITVGTVICQFPSSNILHNYTEIISGDTNNRFAVDHSKCEIYLAGYLDCDLQVEYWLTIKSRNASNSNASLTWQLHITVDDVITWPPIYNETCAFEKQPNTVGPNYPIPFVPEVLIGAHSKILPKLSEDYRRTDVNLMNSVCEVDVIFPKTQDIVAYFPYLDLQCQLEHSIVLTIPAITVYQNISCVPDKERYPGIDFELKPDDAFVQLRSEFSHDNINRAIDCTASFLPGYEAIDMPPEILRLNPTRVTASLNYIGCPDGKYGGKCQYDCICQNGATCHVFNGACKCSPGWRGAACDIASPSVKVVPSEVIEVFIGDFISLSCEYHHIDKYNAIWILNGGHVDMLNLYTDHSPDTRILLNMAIITDEMAGRYQCLVTDINGDEYRDEVIIKTKGCVANHWGIKCDHLCNCRNGATCNRSSGCVCTQGWSGVYCSIDVQPPTFTSCPGNISETMTHGETSIFVSWPRVEASDNSGSVNVTSNSKPGDDFTIGTHRVVYTAVDPTNNIAQCLFTVVVDTKTTVTRKIVISAVIIFVIMIILVSGLFIICVRRRQPILLKYTLLTGRFDDDTEQEKKWDAFVACKGNTDEETFVYRTLIPKLEDEYDYSLNVHHKNFLPGEAICTNIVEAITNSRRTILVLSPSFVQSGWCIYELEQAYHEMIGYRHKVIPIMYEDITHMPDLPTILQTILKTISYIEWPKEGSEKEKNRFWKRLIRVMPKKRKRGADARVKYYPLVRDGDAHIQINKACV